MRAAPPAKGHSCPPKGWLNYMFLIDLLPAWDVESIMFYDSSNPSTQLPYLVRVMLDVVTSKPPSMLDQWNRKSFLAHFQPRCELLFSKLLFSQQGGLGGPVMGPSAFYQWMGGVGPEKKQPLLKHTDPRWHKGLLFSSHQWEQVPRSCRDTGVKGGLAWQSLLAEWLHGGVDTPCSLDN